MFHQQLSMLAHPPSLVLEGQSHVYHSLCVLVMCEFMSVDPQHANHNL